MAAYIVDKEGPIQHLLLQKLLYYCQAASLVWDDVRLFKDQIEAWINGPVVPNIWQAFRGQTMIFSVPGGHKNALDDDNRATVRAILKTFGDYEPQLLANKTHNESPWINARHNLAPDERGNVEITEKALRDYFEEAWA